MSERARNAQIVSGNVKRLRESANWSQADLSKKSGVSPASISLIEKGERLPSLMVIRKLATALKVTEAEITGDSENQVADKAQAFFREYEDIASLKDDDKQFILNLAKQFKERNRDKG